MKNEVFWIFALTFSTVAICKGWSIQVNKELNKKHQEAISKLGKNKREYHVGSNNHGSHQQSPSPVNYYQNSGAYDLKPPGSPWSNQFYQPNHQLYPPSNFYPQNNQFYQSNNPFQESNLASFLSKCSERNIYYCKELLAKQLVQHVREMVTYRSGFDPYILSAILNSFQFQSPFTHPEIRTETDLLDNEIPHYEAPYKFQRPEKQHFYESKNQWQPASNYITYQKPLGQSWNEFPYVKPQESPSGHFPNSKPHFNVPASYFRPSGIYGYDPPITFPYSSGAQESSREAKDIPLTREQKTKTCNPCTPSTQNQIDIRNKIEQSNVDNSTIPTSRA